MKNYQFYSRANFNNNNNAECIGKVRTFSRLNAAKHFAKIKNLSLRDFLRIFKVSK